jgi:nicotinate-nucleotide adenylyltransferase
VVKVRRIGLFGGTFDPPHLGHVAALRAAAQSGRFDRIEVTVAGDPYLKNDDVHPAALRLAMAHAAFDGLSFVEVSDMEVRRQGPSYTIDTARELLFEADDVDLIVGADLVSQLPYWHEAVSLSKLVAVGIVPRPKSIIVKPDNWRCYEILMEPVDLSSTFIRDLAVEDADLGQYLPANVIPLFEEARG